MMVSAFIEKNQRCSDVRLTVKWTYQPTVVYFPIIAHPNVFYSSYTTILWQHLQLSIY